MAPGFPGFPTNEALASTTPQISSIYLASLAARLVPTRRAIGSRFVAAAASLTFRPVNKEQGKICLNTAKMAALIVLKIGDKTIGFFKADGDNKLILVRL